VGEAGGDEGMVFNCHSPRKRIALVAPRASA
jgi:hypothetical protein